MPKKANYIANRGFNGIDTSGVLVLSYESFICVLTGAKDSDSECFFSIQGEKGTLRIDGKPNVASNLKIKVIDDKKGTQRDKAGASVRAAVETEFIPKDKHHRMCDEFKAFALMIDSKDYEKADYFMKETLDVMMVIDMIKDDL
jgi:predicted dehydrogenase